ncbi:phage shock protein PspA [Idiomarina xiamenensis]|uniref:Phage shock protein A n=1 Tax=Idiomarina xiamenensis 10-D-4 TaxID=740709 RepID=K2KLF6_9GAMM|nr:phage shock protein PspA [Idiomarina xiamenensis]EKE87432.1 phage shock protein A [Idiomarina xiamenensis 10-D-4]
MGMFTRLTDIVNANLNALLDKAEDPEKMIRLIVQEMQETLVELRGVAASHIAEKKRLQRQIDALTAQSQQWQTKAQQALDHDREDLARAALQQKLEAEQQRQPLQSALAQVQQDLDKLQDDIGRIQQKLSEAKQRQQQAERRHGSADIRLKVRQQSHAEQVDQALQKFERYEHKIDSLEAELEAYDLTTKQHNLQAEFQALQQQEQLDNELAALKAQRQSSSAQ